MFVDPCHVSEAGLSRLCAFPCFIPLYSCELGHGVIPILQMKMRNGKKFAKVICLQVTEQGFKLRRCQSLAFYTVPPCSRRPCTQRGGGHFLRCIASKPSSCPPLTAVKQDSCFGSPQRFRACTKSFLFLGCYFPQFIALASCKTCWWVETWENVLSFSSPLVSGASLASSQVQLLRGNFYKVLCVGLSSLSTHNALLHSSITETTYIPW